MKRVAAALAVLTILSACGTRAPAPSPAASTALTSVQRGAQAFARGDLAAAQREYTTALHVYESLADPQGRAVALLSLSRIASASGRPADALAAVDQVLAEPAPLPTATRVTAHGRAAALHMAQGAFTQADAQLANANALCAGTCTDAGALTVLRARSALLQQQPALAVRLASEAIAMPALAATIPATLKPQANAERANALRVMAEAQLQSSLAAPAVTAATEALALDRALGLPDRVLLDLQLLARAHQSAGAGSEAQRYQLLAERAQAAGHALRGTQAD